MPWVRQRLNVVLQGCQRLLATLSLPSLKRSEPSLGYHSTLKATEVAKPLCAPESLESSWIVSPAMLFRGLRGSPQRFSMGLTRCVWKCWTQTDGTSPGWICLLCNGQGLETGLWNWGLPLRSSLREVEHVSHVLAYLTTPERCVLPPGSLCWHEMITLSLLIWKGWGPCLWHPHPTGQVVGSPVGSPSSAWLQVCTLLLLGLWAASLPTLPRTRHFSDISSQSGMPHQLPTSRPRVSSNVSFPQRPHHTGGYVLT